MKKAIITAVLACFLAAPLTVKASDSGTAKKSISAAGAVVVGYLIYKHYKNKSDQPAEIKVKATTPKTEKAPKTEAAPKAEKVAPKAETVTKTEKAAPQAKKATKTTKKAVKAPKAAVK
jgi:hypothetical protein